MDILEKDEIRLLLNIGYAACAKGKVILAKRIFDNLAVAYQDVDAVKIGQAFSYVVVDKFDMAYEILLPLQDSENVKDEVCALLAFSYALEKKEEESKEYATKVSEENPQAFALAQSALSLLS